MTSFGCYLPDDTRDALNELGVKITNEDSSMFSVHLQQGDKIINRGGASYYWIRERTFVLSLVDHQLHKLEPWSNENLDSWRQVFNNTRPTF
jgi:hypothetical protein